VCPKEAGFLQWTCCGNVDKKTIDKQTKGGGACWVQCGRFRSFCSGGSALLAPLLQAGFRAVQGGFANACGFLLETTGQLDGQRTTDNTDNTDRHRDARRRDPNAIQTRADACFFACFHGKIRYFVPSQKKNRGKIGNYRLLMAKKGLLITFLFDILLKM